MVTYDDRKFLAGPFHRIEGWCEIEAAAITLYLQRAQLAQGWTAPNYEIGVFKGKYLSILHRIASEAGQRTTGIDIFTVEPRVLVVAGLDRELGAQTNLTLIERDSSTFSVSELAAAVGAPASWISVDGDHSAEGVERDLRNAEATLAPWGVVAVDDFMNCFAIGVMEGSIRYLTSGASQLRPFCVIANKLLLANKDQVEFYHRQVPAFCLENPDYPKTSTFVKQHTIHDDGWYTQQLFGCPIWMIA